MAFVLDHVYHFSLNIVREWGWNITKCTRFISSYKYFNMCTINIEKYSTCIL